jgi:hypothetical protein
VLEQLVGHGEGHEDGGQGRKGERAGEGMARAPSHDVVHGSDSSFSN